MVRGHPHVDFMRLLIKNIIFFPSYLEAVSSIGHMKNLRIKGTKHEATEKLR
jgi:hypothetical protein